MILVVGWKTYPAYVEFYFLESSNHTVKALLENRQNSKQKKSFPTDHETLGLYGSGKDIQVKMGFVNTE